MARYVPFQKLRIFMWSLKMAGAAGANTESNPQLSAAYRELVELGKQALRACSEGRQDAFIAKLDALAIMNRQDELERMLAGTHEDVPEWLRKDR